MPLMYGLMAVILALAAILLLLSQSRTAGREQRLIEQRLGGDATPHGAGQRMARAFDRMSESGLGRRLQLRDEEVRLLLNQAGWSGSTPRRIYLMSIFLVPLLFVAIVLVVLATPGHAHTSPLLPLSFAAGIGFLLPKRVLAYFAGKRRQRLADEVILFIQLIRILFDSGLTVEQSLRVVSREGRSIVPVLVEELDGVLAHAESGLDLADELELLSKRLAVGELSDCCNVLRQMLRQGGSARGSLLTLKQLFEDRRLTGLQEKVSKMSAKMSLVMMTLLFPALLIILAGPGFLAITKALGRMG
ncbi:MULTISPECIES: type II secretion system F family protein [unclassified Pseudomonas]|uniref:type II secretion system F family protein n=1 Tax=unclassified Pseudomonas TaxID=196821 RepID=UPI0009D9B17B|nr:MULTISPECIES: type II secretion system F family protein [unclassified Pseudomonas]MBD9513566.1 type II secretion system F family protein [Pseudomonas sp. PDM22]MBD9632221.1 type II secretion system F family protein [Pseudomonas sp. PDM19]MBD9682830.1 type II secretion system F family protein [Pseudomonas sp. PDM20]OQR34693.1 TadC [Pseudomonas sp. T]